MATCSTVRSVWRAHIPQYQVQDHLLHLLHRRGHIAILLRGLLSFVFSVVAILLVTQYHHLEKVLVEISLETCFGISNSL